MSDGNLEMPFKFDDPTKVVSHWMLQSLEVAEAVAATPEFKAEQTLIARVTVNGVELPFKDLEQFFQHVAKSHEERLEQRYADVEREVQRRLEDRMKDEAQPIIDKLHDLSNALNDAGDLIKPYWER